MNITHATGTLTRAGTFPIRDEETTGYVVTCTPAELAAVRQLPMYRRVMLVPEYYTPAAPNYGLLSPETAVKVRVLEAESAVAAAQQALSLAQVELTVARIIAAPPALAQPAP